MPACGIGIISTPVPPGLLAPATAKFLKPGEKLLPESGGKWWPGSESNQRHADFQSAALPTELPGRGAAHYKEAPRVCTNRPGLAGTSKKQNPGAATGLSRYRLLAGGDVIRRGCGAL